MNTYFLTVVISLFCLTMLTRSLPFLFAKQLGSNTLMKALGRRLTAYIMLLLVIYQINPASFAVYPYGLPAVFSLLVVITVHLLFRNPLVSMIIGTVCFVLINLNYT